eukprot:TRINITY_DN74893_c0_g1_i1.p1 TRINITY_DN74893_c0_g1~~TRINITY_DN74893_c0_g1_i1.p1  ORF type:complete len:424 (+),score=116.44 TRINITY_DN74893_c0_g1_i1:48-1319(+)
MTAEGGRKGSAKGSGKGGKKGAEKGGGSKGKDTSSKGKGKGVSVRRQREREQVSAPHLSKRRTLELIHSLSASDDERTSCSKKLSWILRHGVDRLGLHADKEKWVALSEVLSTKVMDDVDEQKVLDVIHESNSQKPRYEMRKIEGMTYIRAITKDERRAMREGKEPKSRNSQAPADSRLKADAQEFVPSPDSYQPVQPISIASLMPPASRAAPQRAPPPPMYNNPLAALTPSSHMGYPMHQASPMGFQMGLPGLGFGMLGQPQAMGAGTPMAHGGQKPIPAGPLGGMGAGQQYNGRIKSYNPEKGFGFIECPATHGIYGRDVFLNKEAIGDLGVGMQVFFTVKTNKDGMPQAMSVSRATGGGQGKAGGKGKASAKSAGKKGGGKGGKPKKDGEKAEKEAGAAAAAEGGAAEPVPAGETPAKES